MKLSIYNIVLKLKIPVYGELDEVIGRYVLFKPSNTKEFEAYWNKHDLYKQHNAELWRIFKRVMEI